VRFKAVLLQLLASGSARRPWDCEAVLKHLLILPGLCWVSHRSQFARAIFARAFDGVGPERLWERRRVARCDAHGHGLRWWCLTWMEYPLRKEIGLDSSIGKRGHILRKGLVTEEGGLFGKEYCRIAHLCKSKSREKHRISGRAPEGAQWV
jgi:hypothetical protein